MGPRTPSSAHDGQAGPENDEPIAARVGLRAEVNEKARRYV